MTKSRALSMPKTVALRVPDFQRVYLTLVGCGGTGSHLASGLAAIAQALGERGVSTELLLVDPDRIEPANVGRQLFGPGDAGQFKAAVLAERIRAAFGVQAGAACRAIDRLDTFRVDGALCVVVGAVDNPAARAHIARQVKASSGKLWWLDCGNESHSGQVALGSVEAKALKGAIALGLVDRLPAPHVVYPDLVKRRTADRGNRRIGGESCAELAAAGAQSLMINRMVAAWALAMLHDFLVTRDLRYFAVDFDLAWGGVRARAIDAPALREWTK